MYMGREVYVHSNSFGADQPPAQQKQLHGYKRLNRTEECLACFDEMLFYGVKPSTRTYDGTTFRGVGALTDPCSHVNSTYPPPHTHAPADLTRRPRGPGGRRAVGPVPDVPRADGEGRREAQRHHVRLGDARGRARAGPSGRVSLACICVSPHQTTLPRTRAHTTRTGAPSSPSSEACRRTSTTPPRPCATPRSRRRWP